MDKAHLLAVGGFMVGLIAQYGFPGLFLASLGAVAYMGVLNILRPDATTRLAKSAISLAASKGALHNKKT